MSDYTRHAAFCDGTESYRIPAQPKPGDTLRLRLRTAATEGLEAYIFINDSEGERLEPVEVRDRFVFFEYSMTCPEELFTYYFLINDGSDAFFYTSAGAEEGARPEYRFRIMPGFSTPDWAKGAVMYQIFTDRFCNSDPTNSVMDDEYSYLGKHVKRVIDWNKLPEAEDIRNFYGGDLTGVRKRFDHLQYMGVEAIYFNPLFVSPSNHKYDTQDYDHIDPHFTVIPRDEGEVLADGDNDNTHATRYITRVCDLDNLKASNEFFAEFVKEAHDRGIRVILDGVFNHCGSFNKWLDRQLIYDKTPGYEKGAYVSKDSPYRTFFNFRKDDWPNNDSYDGWWGHPTLPKLNYENSPELFEYIMRVAEKWVSPPYNADGWRLDVAADLGMSPAFNHFFWKEFRKRVKAANPEAIIIAENYEGSENWLLGDEWDTIMNYEAFMEPVGWFLTGMDKHSDAYRGELLDNNNAFWATMRHNMAKMDTPSLQTAMNQLSNHDHARFMTRTNRRVGRLQSLGSAAASEGIMHCCMREAIVIQATWPGAPCVYYGDEAGVCGWTDPDNRRTFPWGREDRSLMDFYKQLLGMHKAYRVLKTGSFKYLTGTKGVISYARFNEEEVFIVAVNNNDYDININIPVWETGITDETVLVRMVITYDCGYSYSAEMYRLENGMLGLHMDKFSALVFKNLPSSFLPGGKQ